MYDQRQDEQDLLVRPPASTEPTNTKLGKAKRMKGKANERQRENMSTTETRLKYIANQPHWLKHSSILCGKRMHGPPTLVGEKTRMSSVDGAEDRMQDFR